MGKARLFPRLEGRDPQHGERAVRLTLCSWTRQRDDGEGLGEVGWRTGETAGWLGAEEAERWRRPPRF
jgi:hypothetical protein